MRPDDPFDDAVAARAVIAPDGTLTRWSEGARRLLGHTAEEVVGRPAAELLARGGPPRLPADRWSGTLALRRRDGGTVTVWVLAHHRQRDRGPGEWLAVTPLAAAEHDLPDDPLVRAAVFQSPCATMVFDEALRLRGVNDAMARLLELPADQLRGLRPTDVGGRPQHIELERHLDQVLRTGRPYEMQTYVKATGESRAHPWMARL